MLDLERLDLLLDRHADLLLDRGELAELEVMLRVSPQARERFWERAKWNAAIRSWGESAVGSELPARPAAGSGRSRRWLIASGAAAVLAVAALLQARWTVPDETPVARPLPPEPSGRPAARHVAVITAIDDVTWTNQPRVLGEPLPPCRLSLEGGSLGIAFADGARVVLRGPAEFDVHSGSRGELLAGGLSARIPPGAEGFVIDTPSVEVVDLGTEFGVRVGGNGIADVRVFKGVVETRSESSPRNPFERLEENMSRSFGPLGLIATGQAPAAEEFPPLEEDSPSRPITSGAVHLLNAVPPTLKGLQSDDFILLYRETEGTRIPAGCLVDIVSPGVYSNRRQPKPRGMRGGRRVDSYLLHFDALPRPNMVKPDDSRGAEMRLDGSVRFAQQIVGIICSGKTLAASDETVGGGVTRHTVPDGQWRGIEPFEADRIVLSKDRQTLSLSLLVHAIYGHDQIRVLVAADGPPEPTAGGGPSTATDQSDEQFQ